MKIAFFARDPGAANLLKDYFAASDGWERAFYAKDYARDALARADLPYVDFNAAFGDRPNEDAIGAWLRSLGSIDLIVTGTSHYDDLTDRMIWEAAAERGIPTLAGLDQWIRLRERFVLPDGREFRPDWILAPDASEAERAREGGFARRGTLSAPLPHLAELLSRREEILSRGPRARAFLEEAFGRKIGWLVTFVSEPQTRLSGLGAQFADVQHSEHALYDQIAAALAVAGRADAMLLVKQHPKEDPGSFAGRTPYVIRAEMDRHELMAASDVAVGTKSMLLIEAAVLGRPVVGLEYALGQDERLATSALGLSRSVRSPEELPSALQRALEERDGPSAEQAAKAFGAGTDWRAAWRSAARFAALG